MRLPAPASALVLVVLAGVLSGCGSDGDSAQSEATPTKSASAEASSAPPASSSPPKREGTRVRLTVRGDSVTPRAKLVKVERGKPVVFVIDSDRPGSLHVHSSPEQESTFGAGTSKVSVTLDMPGVVEVEEHEADVLVAQLEVR